MIPWVKEYITNPNDCYIHPTLKKLKPDEVQISDYTELFPNMALSADNPKRTILIKGEEGFGKTTLSKNIYMDWAEGRFTSFDIVFFVQLKLVKPDHDIVDAIIEQTPYLRDSKFEKSRLRNYLDTFGTKCLIILDCSTENSGVAKRIIRRANEVCSTLVTYLNHLSASIEKYFETTVWLQGFNYDQALSYCSKMFQQKERKHVWMRFFMTNFAVYDHVSPMLLLLTCILDHTDTELATDVPVGEIFFRSIKFVYMKHVSPKQLDWGKFQSFFGNIGRVALRCLAENSHSFSKTELGRDICKEALSSGILTEQQCPSLSTDSSDDSMLLFAHDSFKYIFGAYSLVQPYGPGVLEKRLQDTVGTLLLRDPLFSHFALWFTYDGFSSENQRKAYSKIKALIADKIDIIELDLSHICILDSTINIYFGKINKDNKILKLFEYAVSMCKNIKHLVLSSSKDEITKRISTWHPILIKLAVIQISENTSTPLPHHLTLPTGSSQSPMIIQIGDRDLKSLIISFDSLNKRPKLCILSPHAQSIMDMPGSKMSKLKELHVVPNVRSTLKSGDLLLTHCPYLTHLSLRNLQLTHDDVSSLCGSKEMGNLPKLTFLDLSGSDVKGKLAGLFKSKWAELTHLY